MTRTLFFTVGMNNYDISREWPFGYFEAICEENGINTIEESAIQMSPEQKDTANAWLSGLAIAWKEKKELFTEKEAMEETVKMLLELRTYFTLGGCSSYSSDNENGHQMLLSAVLYKRCKKVVTNLIAEKPVYYRESLEVVRHVYDFNFPHSSTGCQFFAGLWGWLQRELNKKQWWHK